MNKSISVSCFDMIGPAMIGPSSSHTAGACRLGLWANKLCAGQVSSVVFTLYGSFASTYKGHGTDRALLAGVMGFDVDDPSIRDAFEIAKNRGLSYRYIEDHETLTDHPNTVRMDLVTGEGRRVSVVGESIGGGRARVIQINGVEVKFNGRLNALLIHQQDRPGVLAHITQCFAKRDFNIAFLNLYRSGKGDAAFTLVESDAYIPEHLIEELEAYPKISQVLVLINDEIEDVNGAVQERVVDKDARHPYERPMCAEEDWTKYLFASGQSLLSLCEKEALPVHEIMIRREMFLSGKSRTSIQSEMKRMWQVMQQSIEEPLTQQRVSMGGLIGGEGRMVIDGLQKGPKLLGDIAGPAVAYALAVLEQNASMGLIVAAPTAGASGIMPAVLYALKQAEHFSDEAIVEALFMAAALAYLIQLGFSLSGAEGGCQAEVGSGAAMAAASIVALYGASAEASMDAASMTLMNMLGLVCDPIAGLVELPCQIRNAAGATIAFSSAQMVLSGMRSVLPIDEMIEVCHKVGNALPASLRETAQGGVATAPTALRCAACAFK